MVCGICLGLPLLTGSLIIRNKYLAMTLILLILILIYVYMDCKTCSIKL
ncbi:hypothetical protein KM759_gp028 [Lymphocystis disease virus 4]|uniref:Uncharacterized protein n=1 Tax=Lymphocystis disease virus 4 TaxID=2704413 RepID=A0A6B9XN46_9VIRU|nr:hypothetical protein KM759_gp028 [Lymphocystis disease virus 4]QHR78572.1 hypothetical protein [Lymphocystis disease virus 4]